MRQKTGTYELLYIRAADGAEEALKPIEEKVQKTILSDKSQIIYEEPQGRKRFAYHLGKHSYGYYFLLQFSAPGDAIRAIDRQLRLMPEILRYRIVSIVPKTPAERSKEQLDREKRRKSFEQTETVSSREHPTVSHRAAGVIPHKVTEEPKVVDVDIEALDKKLDEILDTKDLL
jgi:small subunit ribosomal protein S6